VNLLAAVECLFDRSYALKIYIIVQWQSLCVIEFIWLSVYITGHSRIISSGVVDWIWYWTSKLMEVIGQYHLGQARYKVGSHWNHWMNTIIVR